IKPGSGPRHMAFSPDGKFTFVINELGSTITSFAYDAERGRLREIATVSSLPPEFTGQNSCAEIAVHPSGKWLYGSNRGSDTVTLFAIDAAKGTLSYVAAQNSGGKVPRHFGLAPSGTQLLVANQNSDSLLMCDLDAGTGRLTAAEPTIEAPSPVCVVF